MSATGAKTAGLRYDPLGRLYETSGPMGTTRFLYDGDELVAEYDGAGTLLRRYVHGTGVDDPVVWYEGSSTASPRWLLADNQGSVLGVTDAGGTPLATNRYDEYGVPQSTNIGRFQYTGQAWLPELGMYYYKARIYSPTLGRFLQTDPIRYKDQVNLYAYVGGDPVNFGDPSGLFAGANTCSWAGGSSCAGEYQDNKPFQDIGKSWASATPQSQKGKSGATRTIITERTYKINGKSVSEEIFRSLCKPPLCRITENQTAPIRFFRGGDFSVTPSDYKIGKDGFVSSGRGMSVFSDKGMIPSRYEGNVRELKLAPEGLMVIQRGNNSSHYEVVPSRPMTEADYVARIHYLNDINR